MVGFFSDWCRGDERGELKMVAISFWWKTLSRSDFKVQIMLLTVV